MKLKEDTPFIKRVSLKNGLISLYNQFPLSLPVIRNFQEILFHPNVTYLIGEIGMGKSTLLEGISMALGFNPEGGTLNFNFSSYEL
jgi:predicted ATPase